MIDLTMSELVALRQLERKPGSSTYDIFRDLREDGIEMPMQTAYRVTKSLFALCAIEICRTGVHSNGVPIVYYELSDAGKSSLDEMRSFLTEQAVTA